MRTSTSTKIAVVGLGYVGLPLSLLFLENGFEVIGIDVDEQKIQSLKNGVSYLSDLPGTKLMDASKTRRWEVTTDFRQISKADGIILCVPTPLNEEYKPNLEYVRRAAESIKPHLRKGQLVVLESTTYPGTTEEILVPLLSSEKFQAGRDFFIGYSPERVDPGSKGFMLGDIPKVVSGYTKACQIRIEELYGRTFKKIVPVSNTRTAEMVKIMENSQRLVNISLINEFDVLCRSQNINVWEVIEAASTKPYGFMPFFPGPGIGGHCIPIDPLYLKWKANQLGLETPMIDVAHQINVNRPKQVVEQLKGILGVSEYEGKSVLVLGVTYKKDVNDVRESPSLPIIENLIKEGAMVRYYDPYVPKLSLHSGKTLLSEVQDDLMHQVQAADCVLIVTDHSDIDYKAIVQESRLVVDTRNATKDLPNSNNVILL